MPIRRPTTLHLTRLIPYATVPPAVRQGDKRRFLGAFTTFSTFSYETVSLLRDGDWTRATLYTGLSFVLVLTAVLVGIGAASFLLRVRG